TVCSKERKSFDQRGGSNNTISRVFRIRRRKPDNMDACATGNREDDEPCLDFTQKRFEADVEANASFVRENCQLQQTDVGNSQTPRFLARVIDGGCGVLRQLS